MQNISISKSDWDAQKNELVRLSKEVQHSCCTNPCTNPCNENVNTNVVRQECRTSYRLADLMEACKEVLDGAIPPAPCQRGGTD